MSKRIKYETVTLLTPKIRFPMLMICPMSLSRSSLESAGKEGGHSPWKRTQERIGIFAWNLNHDFIRNILAHSSLKSENIPRFFFYFLLFAVIYDSYVIKTKYILLELKHNDPWVPFLKPTTVLIIFWNLQIFYQMFLSQQVKRNAIITNQNGKYELTDDLSIDVRLKKISKLHGVIV